MFLHLCVILFRWGEGGGIPECIIGHMTKGVCIGGGSASRRGSASTRGSASRKGVCIWGSASRKGLCIWGSASRGVGQIPLESAYREG